MREAAAAATAERTAEAEAAGSWAGQGAAGPGPDPFWVREDEAETAAVEAGLGVGEALRRRAYSCVMDAGGPGGGGSTLKPVLALQRGGRKVRYLQ